jgi:hypothetical protein
MDSETFKEAINQYLEICGIPDTHTTRTLAANNISTYLISAQSVENAHKKHLEATKKAQQDKQAQQ